MRVYKIVVDYVQTELAPWTVPNISRKLPLDSPLRFYVVCVNLSPPLFFKETISNSSNGHGIRVFFYVLHI